MQQGTETLGKRRVKGGEKNIFHGVKKILLDYTGFESLATV